MFITFRNTFVTKTLLLKLVPESEEFFKGKNKEWYWETRMKLAVQQYKHTIRAAAEQASIMTITTGDG